MWKKRPFLTLLLPACPHMRQHWRTVKCPMTLCMNLSPRLTVGKAGRLVRTGQTLLVSGESVRTSFLIPEVLVLYHVHFFHLEESIHYKNLKNRRKHKKDKNPCYSMY